MLEKHVTSQMKHMHLYYVRIIYTHINIMKTHIHVNHPTISHPQKMIKLFPSSLHLCLIFVPNMKERFPESQLGEVQM